MMLQFLASYCHLAILLLQLTFVLNKNKIFQGFHLSTLYTIIIYYHIYYYHNLTNNDNYLNPTTYGGKSPIGILNKVGPFQEILKIVTNLFIFDRSCQKTITLLVSYKR